MNPFFIFLFVCTFAAIIFWFKRATPKQGITALKGVLIGIAVLLIILVATGRLPIFSGIPLLMIALFRKVALTKLLVPFIRFLAGSAINNRRPYMDTEQALKALKLSENPSREEIVQAHRKITRVIKNSENPNHSSLTSLDAAREHLIQEIDSSDSNKEL